MKYFFTALIITILTSGCATKTAFSKLGISPEQELAIENTRTGKIQKGTKIEGVYSAINLNAIYPDMNKNKMNFYVSIYIKDKQDELYITLNGKEPTSITPLEKDNRFSHLQSIENNWINNYLLSFENDEKAPLKLLIESGQFSSGILTFVKEI